MTIFYKYHGAGNDFIMIDNRDGNFDIKNIDNIKLLCHRRFGVGADGIILLEEPTTSADKQEGYDFKMVFANNDGSMGPMCGNGGRCIVDFAYNVLKIIKDPQNINFIAVDGEHKAEILGDGQVKLKMQDIKNISTRNDLPFVLCGTTPHNIMFVENLKEFPVFETGRKIRNSDSNPNGINANFVEIKDDIVNVRTYERGVEDETLACGTGAVSVAIACSYLNKIKSNTCHIKMPGGDLTVEFEKEKNDSYKNIYLTGPAVCVFKGEIK
ncbi:MAG: diaminopimelate epimerase [Candidatus Nomurabacteria bacterium]|nr:diaminopimelate epimerase [Candidatus Nomurabacteria bacterium]